MPQRQTIFQPGHWYHVYNRGVNRQPIFNEDENYRFLLQRVKKYVQRDHISVIAYCLMPNHYHFLLRQDGETPISACIQAVFNSYSKAFNKRYGRVGTLFEDRFDDVPVDTLEYALHLCRYIHRNPIDGKQPLVPQIEQWPYSNYPEWTEQRNGTLLDREFVKCYFKTPEDYRSFVLDYTPPKKLGDEMKKYYRDED